MKAIRDQVEEHTRELLRINNHMSDRRLQRLLKCDVEVGLLSSGAMISEVQGFLDQGIQIDAPALACAFAGVKEHVLHNRVGTAAMLDDLAEVTPEGGTNILDLITRLVA